VRSVASVSSVASLPRIITATSPGNISVTPKMTIETMNSVNAMKAKRRPRNLSIVRPAA
jgi:hypothetical protein